MYNRFSFGLLIPALLLFFCNHTIAQKADTSGHLLWYKGKKINDTTLVRKTGETITWSPSTGNVNVGYQAGSEGYSSFRNGLAQLEANKIETDRNVASATSDGNMRSPGVVAEMNRGIDHAAADITQLMQHEFSIGPSPESERGKEFIQRIDELWDEIRKEHREVMEYINKPYQGYDFAIKRPPTYDFEYCSKCDSVKKKKYSDDSTAFENSFLKEEIGYMNKAIHVLRIIELVDPPEGPDTSFTYRIFVDMNNAMGVISEKINKKLTDIWNTYKNQTEKVPFLVQFLMGYERRNELMGMKPYDGFPSHGELAISLFDAVLKTVKEAEAKNNFKILLNEGKITYMLKYAQLIGLPMNVFTDGIEEYMKINRFTVTVDAEAKIEGNGVSQMAKLHYEGPFDAHTDSKTGKCELRWSPYGIDTTKGLVFELRDVEMKAQKQNITYHGTKEFGTKRPSIHLDFCNNSIDSVIFYPFYPLNGSELWTIGKIENYSHPLVNTTFLICFLDQEAMKKNAEQFKDTATIFAAQKELSNIYQQQVLPNATVIGKEVADMSPKDYERGETLMKATDEIIQKDMSPVYFFKLKGKVKNNNPVIFDEILYGKDVSHYPNIVFATFHVKIEHVKFK